MKPCVKELKIEEVIMKELTRKQCEQLIANRDKVKSVFAWDGGLLHLCCAGI